MELKVGMICKHFKGENLIEKNLYEIVAVNPIYTGEKDVYPNDAVVIYRNIYQDDKYFVREYEDLVCELSDDEKKLYHQSYRIEPLTKDELREIKTAEFVIKKSDYLNSNHINAKKL